MAAFTTGYTDILPDPNNKIGDAGETSTSGTAGPGYASVQLTSDQKVIMSRTNSQRTSARAVAGHKWNINIGYNPMTQAEFNPVYSFLLHRYGAVNPFYVSLPQYRTPQNSSFSTHLQAGTHPLRMFPTTSVAAGQTSMMIRGLRDGASKGVKSVSSIGSYSVTSGNQGTTYTNVPGTGGGGSDATFNVTPASSGGSVTPAVTVCNPGYGYTGNITIDGANAGGSGTFTVAPTVDSGSGADRYFQYNYKGLGTPLPGDLFTVTDAKATNHYKTYMVTRVETNDIYKSGTTQPTENQVFIHFTPGLSKNISASDASSTYQLNFFNPLIRVVSPKGLQQYSLDVNNLYKFSLRLEEAL